MHLLVHVGEGMVDEKDIQVKQHAIKIKK